MASRVTDIIRSRRRPLNFLIFSGRRSEPLPRKNYILRLFLRPVMTPSIARAAAKYFMDEDMPIRLCYMGNTFNNKQQLSGGESAPRRAIGDITVDAEDFLTVGLQKATRWCHADRISRRVEEDEEELCKKWRNF